MPFKIHANFESVLKRFESNDKDRKKFLLMISLANQLFFTEEKSNLKIY